uniref:Gamma-glutamyltransferase n=1 Tax=Acrobeloides nanus TaxID=290746 RepID=A0A914D6S3_9BILA
MQIHLLSIGVTFIVLYVKKDNKKTEPSPPSTPIPPPTAKPSGSVLGVYGSAGVATDNELCSSIGRDTLLKGGNAVDAAIAALLCIGVMDTHSTGLGGGHFMIRSTKSCHVVDAAYRAPLSATKDMYDNNVNASWNGWLAICTPGEIAGLWTEYTNFGGNIPWKDIVQPTVDLVENGYPVTSALADALNTYPDDVKKYLPTLVNPETGNVYQEGDRIKTRYNYSKNPSFDEYVEHFHHFIEASKFAFAWRNLLADMDFLKNATDIAHHIASKTWADNVRSKITDRAHNDSYYYGDVGAYAYSDRHGTTHVTVIDKEGNAVSVTATINLYFGSRRESPSTGIIWNDEMNDFSVPNQPNAFGNDEMNDFSVPNQPNAFGLPPTPWNYIQGGMRPMSQTSALVIYNEYDEKEVMAVGAAGGSNIISATANIVWNALYFNRNVKEAIEMPRIHNQLFPNETDYEHELPKEYVDALKARGHNMVEMGYESVATAIRRQVNYDGPKNQTVYANSDWRKGYESQCAGY